MGGSSTTNAALFPVRAHPRDLLRFSFMQRDAMTVKPRSLYDASFSDLARNTTTQQEGHQSDSNAARAAAAASDTQSIKKKMLLLSRTPPFVVEGANKATPASLYRASFTLTDDAIRAQVASCPSAGKPLPRDDTADVPREGTETSLSRASYVSHEGDVYRQRHRAVLAHRQAVAKRYDEAVAEFQRHRNSSSADGHSRLCSLQQDSYRLPPPPSASTSTQDGGRNGTFVGQEQSKRDRRAAQVEVRSYRMGCTSTQRGDYCVVPRVSATYGQQGRSASALSATSPLHDELLANPVAPLLLVNHAKDLERAATFGGRSSPEAVSAALSAMSTEVADAVSFRAQSSCEVIPQRLPYPGLMVHVPTSQCTGEAVLEKRVLDWRSRQQPRHDVGQRPSSHTPTQIFYEGHSEPYRSLSRVDYRPFQFVSTK